MICLALFLLADQLLQQTSAVCYTSQANVTLRGHVISTFPVGYIMECYQLCKQDTRCQSLNFFLDRRVCEINNRTIALVSSEHAVSVMKATYFENPFRAVIGTSNEVPAVSCSEIHKSSGDAVSGRYWLVNLTRSSTLFMAYCNMTTLAIEDCVDGQCRNGGLCTYFGQQKYKCACAKWFTGRDCEIKISMCDSSPCSNGGTCMDQGGSYTCQCGAGFYGARCFDPCQNYTTISDADRNRNHVTVSSRIKCDNALKLGWYRFIEAAGSQMASTCVPTNHCQTSATGWFSGPLPTSVGSVQLSTVHFHWGRSCKYSVMHNIKVKRCAHYYVYELRPTNCNYRYCGQ